MTSLKVYEYSMEPKLLDGSSKVYLVDKSFHMQNNFVIDLAC